MSRTKRTLSSGPSFASPGSYHLGSISFTLSQRLTGSLNVAGYATARSLLAAIAPPFDEGTVFVDSATQDLLEVRDVIAQDGEVIFYKVHRKNPLAVFTNLRFRTPTASSLANTSYNCSFTGSFYTAGRCTGSAWVNVDPSTGEPIGIPAPPISGQTWGDFLAGGAVEAGGSYEIAINGLTDIEVDYNLDLTGFAATGFVLDGAVGIGSTSLPWGSVTLYGEKRKFFGFDIEIALDGYLGVNLKNLTLNISKPITFDRRLGISARLSGSLSTSKGFVTNPLDYDITPVAMETLDPDDLFAFFDGVKLTATTLVDLGLRLIIKVGSLANLTAEAGATLVSLWDFGADVESCPCPYLYGQVSSHVLLHTYCPGLTVFGYELLKPYRDEWLVVPTWSSPPYCLFQPDKAEEGISTLRLESSTNSWVVEVPQFWLPGWTLGLLVATTIRVRFDAVAGGVVFRDMHTAPFDWSYISPGEQTRLSGKRMVLVSPPFGTVIRSDMTQDVLWWTRGGVSDPLAITGSANTSITLPFDMGYANITITQAINVEPAKEFPGAGGAYLSFQPTYPAGTILGVITHSVVGDQAYSAPVLTRVFDDTEETSAFSSRYTARNELALEVVSFKSTAHPNVTIRFTSEVAGSSGAEIGSGAAVGVQVGQNLPGSTFGFFGPVVIDLTKRPNLTVNAVLVNGEKNRVTANFTFPYAALDHPGNFSLEASASAAAISLRASRSQPNVVFELPSQLTPSHRGIVCKVYDTGDGTVTAGLTGGEKYGIVRFLSVAIPSGRYIGILVSMPGLVPLCAHTELDASSYFIVIAQGQTRFGSDIHIPFRRKDDGDKAYVIKLTSVFSTTEDGICAQGAAVTADAGSDVGCFESIVNGRPFVQNWTVIGGSTNLLADRTIARARLETGENGQWHLQLFRAVRNAVLTFVPSLLAFPERAISFNIGADLVNTIRFQKDVGITINCSFAARLKIIDADGDETIVERSADGFFSFYPGKIGDLVAVALCDTPDHAYCEFQQGFGADGYALLQYGGDDGVRELISDAINGSLVRGVSRQLVRARDNITLYKTWNGVIQKSGSFTHAAALEFVVDKSKAAIRVLAAKLGGVDVPFSAEKYYADPEVLFEAVGVLIPETGLTADVATFTRDGRIVVGEKFFDPEVLNSGNVSVQAAFGLPEEMVTEQSVSEILAADAKSKVNTVAIVCGVIGTLVAIAVVVGIVLVRRRRVDEFRDYALA